MAFPVLLVLAVRACFPVSGERILMRDLTAALPAFAAANAEQVLGFAPGPGVQRRFSAGEVNRLAAGNGVSLSGDASGVCFERKLTPLTREQVMSALRASLPAGAELELLEFSHVQIPEGTLEFPRGGLPPAAGRSPGSSHLARQREIRQRAEYAGVGEDAGVDLIAVRHRRTGSAAGKANRPGPDSHGNYGQRPVLAV